MISVVIVTKGDRRNNLAHCLEALGKQTYRKFEIILVAPKGKGINHSYYPCNVIWQNGEGISNARNCGVKASQGEIIAFTDDDAEPHPNWLEKINQHFKEHPKLCYLGGEFTMNPKNIWQWWIDTHYHLSERSINAGLCHGNNYCV